MAKYICLKPQDECIGAAAHLETLAATAGADMKTVEEKMQGGNGSMPEHDSTEVIEIVEDKDCGSSMPPSQADH